MQAFLNKFEANDERVRERIKIRNRAREEVQQRRTEKDKAKKVFLKRRKSVNCNFTESKKEKQSKEKTTSF